MAFADAGVEVAIVEVVMSARLDATNIIKLKLSVMTNIAFDHTKFSGDTRAEIAGEKASIIKPH